MMSGFPLTANQLKSEFSRRSLHSFCLPSVAGGLMRTCTLHVRIQRGDLRFLKSVHANRLYYRLDAATV